MNFEYSLYGIKYSRQIDKNIWNHIWQIIRFGNSFVLFLLRTKKHISMFVYLIISYLLLIRMYIFSEWSLDQFKFLWQILYQIDNTQYNVTTSIKQWHFYFSCVSYYYFLFFKKQKKGLFFSTSAEYNNLFQATSLIYKIVCNITKLFIFATLDTYIYTNVCIYVYLAVQLLQDNVTKNRKNLVYKSLLICSIFILNMNGQN